jgi:cell division protein FtsB
LRAENWGVQQNHTHDHKKADDCPDNLYFLLMFFIEKHIMDSIIIMKNFQGRKNKRHFLNSWFILLLFSVILIFFVYGVITLFGKMRETSKNKKISEERLANLEDRKKKLEKDIDELSHDKGKERIFREDYGLARAGEGVVVIVDEKNLNIEEVEPKNQGFFGSIKVFFGF